MLTPTPDELRVDSDLLAAKLPDDNGGENDQKLAARARVAAAIVSAITGRKIEPVTEGEEVPNDLVDLAVHAVARFVERRIIQGASAFAEKTASGRILRSFTAGPYSETYFAPGEFSRRGTTGRPQMDADSDLDDTLWALATEDARDAWIAVSTGVQAPAGVASEFDYNRRVRGARGWLAGYGIGPDGF